MAVVDDDPPAAADAAVDRVDLEGDIDDVFSFLVVKKFSFRFGFFSSSWVGREKARRGEAGWTKTGLIRP